MSAVIQLYPAQQPSPNNQKGKVMPTRPKNSAVRSREYLQASEVDRLAKAARKTRYPVRDEALVVVAYRHGLRVSELVNLRWDAVNLKTAQLAVSRLKNGLASTHPLTAAELRLLGKLRRENPEAAYLFMSERGTPMTASNVRKLISRLGEAARFTFPVHPHMLRHACGFKLANDGRDTRAIQQYLGHQSITHTVRYTQLSDEAFKGFFKD